jgi:hypothetical protein
MKHASPVHLERSEKRVFHVLLGMAGIATFFIALNWVSPEASAARKALCIGTGALSAIVGGALISTQIRTRGFTWFSSTRLVYQLSDRRLPWIAAIVAATIAVSLGSAFLGN